MRSNGASGGCVEPHRMLTRRIVDRSCPALPDGFPAAALPGHLRVGAVSQEGGPGIAANGSGALVLRRFSWDIPGL
jgi:hypothetical protein